MLVRATAGIDDAAASKFSTKIAGRRLKPLLVVIAAYNEQDAIGGVLERIPPVVCGLEVDVLVVDDGSADRTADVARAAGVLVCDPRVNRGQGAALRLGYRLAAEHGARLVATLDADGQYDPAQLVEVVTPLVEGTADFVTGSRRLGSAHTTDRFRRAGVVVFAATITVLTGKRVTDPANGLRAMRVEVPAAVTLEQPQYQAAELLIGAIMLGFRVVEVPTTMYQRTAGATKKGRNLMYGVRFGRVIVATWGRERRRPPAGTPRT